MSFLEKFGGENPKGTGIKPDEMKTPEQIFEKGYVEEFKKTEEEREKLFEKAGE